MERSGAISAIMPSSWRDLLSGKSMGASSTKPSALVLSGSIIMLVGSTAVSGFNFLYNVSMARMLGPALFGHVTAAVTIMMLLSAVTLAFQLVCAKFVARNASAFGQARVYEQLLKKSWFVGVLAAALLAAFSGQVARYLNMPDPMVIIVLAAGIAFYVPLGVRRGRLQGLCQFTRLTGNFLIEAAVKLVAAVVFVAVGYGVLGAVGALGASVLAAFAFSRGSRSAARADACEFEPASFREGMQAIVFFVGQVIINNIDILMVKHFFDPRDAGMYAAVALVGRVLYFACWSVVSAMFPVSAAVKDEQSTWQVLKLPLFVVAGMSALAVAIMAAFPEPIMHLVFGQSFQPPADLLALYAGLTGIYSLAVTLITFEMSRRIANTGWLQLVFSAMMIAGIYIFHGTLRQVAMVQLVLMVLLLAIVSLPFVRRHRSPGNGHGTMEVPA